MKQRLAAVFFAIVAGIASAHAAPALSEGQFHKLIKFIETAGAKQEFPAPTAQSLGFSDDPTRALPVLLVVTDDHKVYFARSRLNQNDYVVWVRTPGNKASYMFSTHADLKLMHALYLEENEFPQPLDVGSEKVQTMYRDALAALAKDIDKAKSR